MRLKTLKLVLLGTGLLSLAPDAFAEDVSRTSPVWLRDRRYSEGIGIRVGDFELHPGVGAEVGFDSNWFSRTSSTDTRFVNRDPVPAGVLRVTPSFSISTLSAARREADGSGAALPTVAILANAAATYREFLGEEQVRSQRNLSAIANLRFDILPGRSVGAGVFGNFERTIQGAIAGIGAVGSSFNRMDFGGGGELVLQPGGGTLDWRFGYRYAGTRFEDTAGTPFDNDQHTGFTKGRWRFRPRTALLFDAELRAFNYRSPSTFFALYDSMPIRARLGMNGLISSRFALTLMVGYGGSFNDTTQITQATQFDNVIGQAEFKIFLSANPSAPEEGVPSVSVSSLALGVTRDFSNSYFGGFYMINRGYANLSFGLGGRFVGGIEAGLGAISYPNVFFAGGQLAQTGWTDLRLDTQAFGEYRFSNSFGVNTTVRFTSNFSDNTLPAAGGGGVFDLNWRRFEAYLGARWFM